MVAWAAYVTFDFLYIVMVGPEKFQYLRSLFSKLRSSEHNADHIALLLMTDAGYDPAAAISMHETMAEWEGRRNKNDEERGRSLRRKARLW